MTSRAHGVGMKNAILPAVVLVPFTVFSVFVIHEHGYFGFLDLVRGATWSTQVFFDLVISVFLVGTWIRSDARARGIAALPYLVALPFLGSIAALAYLVHRGLKAAPSRGSPPARADQQNESGWPQRRN